VRSSQRRSDDADVIRARLRVLLAEGAASSGWLPDEDPAATPAAEPGSGPDDAAPLDDPGATGDPGAAAGSPGPPPGVDLGRHRAPGPAVRLAPGRPAVWALAAAGLLAVALVLVWTWLDRPTVTPAPAAPTTAPGAAPHAEPPAARTAGAATPAVGAAAATSSTVVVSVVGLVVHPGLVTLPAGSRVADAVSAAGGLVAPADPATVNLAAVVADGQQIAVGVPGAPDPAGGAAASGGGPVDLNAATAAVLDGLPGIGPVLAQRIVDFRTQHGRFTSVDQLDDVPGIGPALYARLAAQVRV
jgi:competence protein ComEA